MGKRGPHEQGPDDRPHNKEVARYALSFIGGDPKVARFYNEDESKAIAILTCTDSDLDDLTALSTIGLNDIDVGQTFAGSPLRVELMTAGLAPEDTLGRILATTAFDVMDAGYCRYGAVARNVLSTNDIDSPLDHMLLLSPIFWSRYEALALPDRTIAWLYALPISEGERAFIEESGIEAFEAPLERSHADIFDLLRKPIVP